MKALRWLQSQVSIPYDGFVWLPDALHVHVKFGKEDGSMKSEGPENGPVVPLALNAVAWILEGNVVSIDIICTMNIQ